MNECKKKEEERERETKVVKTGRSCLQKSVNWLLEEG